MRVVIVAITILALLASTLATEEKLTESGLVRELVVADQEGQNENAAMPDTSAADDVDEGSADFREVRQAVDALDVCQSERCNSMKSRCAALAHRRNQCRKRLQVCQKQLNLCPMGTSHCVGLRRRIQNLVRKYRYFGGRLRKILQFAKLVAWGPKDHHLKVPKEMLSKDQSKQDGSSAFDDGVDQRQQHGRHHKHHHGRHHHARRHHHGRHHHGRRHHGRHHHGRHHHGRHHHRSILAPRVGRRRLPLPGDDYFEHRRKHLRQYRKLMKRKPETWWQDFVRAAERPVGAAKSQSVARATRHHHRGRHGKRVHHHYRLRSKDWWGRLFNGRSKYFDRWRARRLLASKKALKNPKPKKQIPAAARARAAYWKKVWKRFTGGRVHGMALWKGGRVRHHRHHKPAAKKPAAKKGAAKQPAGAKKQPAAKQQAGAKKQPAAKKQAAAHHSKHHAKKAAAHHHKHHHRRHHGRRHEDWFDHNGQDADTMFWNRFVRRSLSFMREYGSRRHHHGRHHHGRHHHGRHHHGRHHHGRHHRLPKALRSLKKLGKITKHHHHKSHQPAPVDPTEAFYRQLGVGKDSEKPSGELRRHVARERRRHDFLKSERDQRRNLRFNHKWAKWSHLYQPEEDE